MANDTESVRLAVLKVAILITDGFEQVVMTEPRQKLVIDGDQLVCVVSPTTSRTSTRR